jgi:CxxC motif-containing protein (DUF1111 family)
VVAALGLVALSGVAGCGGADPELLDPASGGDATVAFATRNAFGQPIPGLTARERRVFEVGDSFFTQNWVTARASTEARDGLGPLLNAQACASCHVGDGRGRPPQSPEDPERGLLVRLSLAGETAWGAPVPDPVYGDQLQDRAISGVPAEGTVIITHEEVAGSYGDGTTYTLSQPRYQLTDLAYGPIEAALTSPRVAPQVVGMGLLEAVPEAAVLDLADPDDADGDGVSGRPNYVATGPGEPERLGRFGWKANVATVRDQVAGAFAGDIGITSDEHPEENCPTPAAACRAAPTGGSPEIPADRMDDMEFYSRTLAVPARRRVDEPEVERGAEVFAAIGCTACHTPTLLTGDHPVSQLSGQEIHPYTDLLLHDMGPGLADGRPDFLATGSEWRTPPLWGIGLVETVNGHSLFLHDGRARSLEEAVLWHGGEAAGAQGRFVALDAADRAAVIAFLESL